MKSLTLVPLLGLAILVISHANAATVTYNFDDGMQSWANVQTSTTGPTEFFQDTDTNNSRIDQEYTGDGSLRPNPFGNRDDTTSVALWVRSPEFSLVDDPLTEISFGLIGGAPGTNAAPTSVSTASLTATSTAQGFTGMVLRRVSDEAFLLTGVRSANGQDTHETITWDSTTIGTAISGDLSSETYTLDLIDSKDNSWGWIGVDDVSITSVPEPSTAPLIGLFGCVMLLRRRR